MLRLSKLIPLIFLLPSLCWAAPTLQWEGSQNADGYIIYYNEFSKDVGNVTLFPISDLNLHHNVLYNITVTAYNVAGEGLPSNSVAYKREGFVPYENPSTYNITIPNAVVNIIINGAEAN